MNLIRGCMSSNIFKTCILVQARPLRLIPSRKAGPPSGLRHNASTPTSNKTENVNVGHARFLAEAKTDDSWRSGVNNAQKGGVEGVGNELDGVEQGKGKLSPTSSHLFKLIIPLDVHQPPTVFLLHPSQPLSHVSRLISSSLANKPINIFFRSPAESIAQRDHLQTTQKIQETDDHPRKDVQWSDSTDIGDFIKSAVRASVFRIVVQHDKSAQSPLENQVIEVTVPTFERRTMYLNNRLTWLGQQLREMESIKKSCDVEAHQSARRLATGGLGLLVAYWLVTFRLTFWDLDWNTMEPAAYFTGVGMIILGYVWFLYQGREVSYSSVMDTSISRRRSQLYEARGFDIDRWTDLVMEEKAIKREISKIAQDYGLEWSATNNRYHKGEKKADSAPERHDESDSEDAEDKMKERGQAVAEAEERRH